MGTVYSPHLGLHRTGLPYLFSGTAFHTRIPHPSHSSCPSPSHHTHRFRYILQSSHRLPPSSRPPRRYTRHTDWISCCALLPSTTAGCPPSACASGGRDGSVRFWSKSAAAAAAAPSQHQGKQGSKGDKTSLLRAAFASGSRSTSGRGSSDFVGGGGSGGGGSAASLGDGGWSLAACMTAAHGSSEFVTCCSSPGGSSGAIGGWVATGGTDWSVSFFFFCGCCGWFPIV